MKVWYMTQCAVLSDVMETSDRAMILGGHGSHTFAYPRIILKVVVV